jgi:hypothetical protein
VLDLSSLDLEDIGNALADQTDYEHRWLINPQTGEIAFWAADTGIDGQTPVDVDDLDHAARARRRLHNKRQPPQPAPAPGAVIRPPGSQ